MRRFWIKLLLLLACLLGLALVYRSDRILFEQPAERVSCYLEEIGEILDREHGLHLLATAGGAAPMDWVTGTRLNLSGVEVVSDGPLEALRFDGRGLTFAETAQSWARVGPRFTISTWVALETNLNDQAIVFTSSQRGVVGIRLENGQMVFHIPPWDQKIAYPYESYGRFSHIVAVADGGEGVARLYENGELKASGPIGEVIPPDNHNIEFGISRWYAEAMLIGRLAETAIWRRALTAAEVKEVHRARGRLVEKLAGSYHKKWRAACLVQRAVGSALKVVDRFNPLLHPARAHGAELPKIDLFLSKADRRHFNRAHHESRRSARRVRAAARPRRVHFSFAGRTGQARLRLHGDNAGYPFGERMAFVVDVDDGAVMGMKRVLLALPEDAGFLLPLVETRTAEMMGFPAVKNGLCRLFINGEFNGVYYYEDFERMGVFPGSGTRLFRGPRHPYDWGARFRKEEGKALLRLPLEGKLPIAETELSDIFDGLMDVHWDALINDAASPLSSRERAFRLEQIKRRLADTWQLAPEEEGLAKRAGEALNPNMLLGENPSPFFVIHDLDLTVFRLPGVALSWRSSDPAFLSDDGRVTRPRDARPREVTLTAIVSDGRENIEKEFRFRIMPENRAVPAMMLYVRDRFDKAARVDCIAHYYPAGCDGPPRVFTAFQDTGGGLKGHGNTSYWGKRKQPFSLRLDEAHGLLDDTATRHLILTTGYKDPSFMRNKLSYDLFRRLGAPGAARHAPRLAWIEIFANGAYHGLYEMQTRVGPDMLGFQYKPGHEPQDVIFKAGEFQIFPRRRKGDYSGRILDFARFLGDSDSETLRNEIGDWLDLDNAVDFHLSLNIIQGQDNLESNFYLARAGQKRARFFFVLFDCDKVWQGISNQWYRNRFLERIEAEAPEFIRRMLERWREIRPGPANPRLILEEIADAEGLLKDYIDWEYEKWGYNNNASFEQHVRTLRDNIAARFVFLDEAMTNRPIYPTRP